jgi:hypothetical protein
MVRGCAFNYSFGYYMPPQVLSVQPKTGPRYGSFPLTVFLEDSLDNIMVGKVSSP